MSAIIETKNLTKKFGDFTAVDDISLSVEQGEIRAIIGENGAGKTTLMNMLYGILQPTSGSLAINGETVVLRSPKDAIELGIGMVHQHFKLVESLTVYENILLGAEINKTRKIGGKTFRSALIDNETEREKVQALIDQFKFQLNVDDRIRDISVGAKQCVEILKMLYRKANVLILDEPTAVLIPQEVNELMNRLQELKKNGHTIIIITHKLGEVKMCADNISVIRNGRLIGTVPNDDRTTEEDLAQMMVGRPVINTVRSEKPVGERVILDVKGLTARDYNGRDVIKDVSFAIHENEILGVAGVEGNGQTELMWLLSGCMKVTGGNVQVDGVDVTADWPDQLRKSKVGIIPEDRYRQGLCLHNKVSENLIAGYHSKPEFCRRGIMQYDNIRENKEKLRKQFDIRLSSDDPLVSELSGGNAQKIVVAREMSNNPDLMLACQPTRGIDIGATEFVHQSLINLRDMGKAILLISSDLAEVMALSDRIVVMYRGQITGEFDARTVTPEELGLYMSGARSDLKQEAAA